MGLNHAAVAALDRLTRRGAAHAHLDESLHMLTVLAARVPEVSAVMRSVERYRPTALSRLSGSAASRLHYWLGRRRYEAGGYAEALAHFSRVTGSDARSAEARLFEGVSHVRLRRAGPAAAAFERAAESADPQTRELAWLSLARLRYSVSMQVPTETPLSRPLGGALAAWRQIPMGSQRFVGAFTEETWALYLGGNPTLALGHAHALRMPELQVGGASDAEVVRAMIQLEHCQWDALEHTVERFTRASGPQLVGADRSVRMAATRDDAWRVLLAVRAHHSRIPRPVRHQVRSALGGDVLTRQVQQVRSIDRERASLAGLGLESQLLTRVRADLDAARGRAVERAAGLTRAALVEMRDGLRARASRMDTIELELNTQRRRELVHPNNRPMEPAEGGPITTVQAGQRWPWDGEWWPDELPHFRQSIQNRCGR